MLLLGKGSELWEHPLTVARAGWSSAGAPQGRSFKTPAWFLRVGRSTRAGVFAPAGNMRQLPCAVHPPWGWCWSRVSPAGSVGGGGCCSLSRERCCPLGTGPGQSRGTFPGAGAQLGWAGGEGWKGTCPCVGSATMPAVPCRRAWASLQNPGLCSARHGRLLLKISLIAFLCAGISLCSGVIPDKFPSQS